MAILAGGCWPTAAAAVLTERLYRGREGAEQLTGEVCRVYLEQALGRRDAAACAAAAADAGNPGHADRGPLSGRRVRAWISAVTGMTWCRWMIGRFMFVIGDVSGHGIRAAAVMASLHYAGRAYALEGHHRGRSWTACAELDLTRDGHFATVLCGLAEVAAHTVVLANAGHLPPLICGEAVIPVWSRRQAGPPVGIPARSRSVPADGDDGSRACSSLTPTGSSSGGARSWTSGLKRLQAAAGRDTLRWRTC